MILSSESDFPRRYCAGNFYKNPIDIRGERYYNTDIPAKEVGINDEHSSQANRISVSAPNEVILLPHGSTVQNVKEKRR
jgi:hypothetical protein